MMGGDFAVRRWHHLFMCFFVIFTFHNISPKDLLHSFYQPGNSPEVKLFAVSIPELSALSAGQVPTHSVDEQVMTVSNINTIASLVSGMKKADINLQIQVAVLKQGLEQQKQQARGLLKMMDQSRAIVDGHVDVYA